MGKLWRDVLISFTLGMVLPAVCVGMANREPVPEVQTEIPETVFPLSGQSIRLRDSGGNIAEMDLEQYLTGVLLAEMPVDFEVEALKAQAVAARTFTWKAYETGGKHGDGSICREYTCCQAYLPEETYLRQGGIPEDVEKVRSAVASTAGQVLTYEGELIEAVYFSCSGGRTEDALAVWGVDYPYLRSIHSPGEDIAPFYSTELFFTKAELEKRLETELPQEPEQWVTDVIYTHGGGVAEIWIGGRKWSGPELRECLQLRSTDFELYPSPQGLRIVTHGYGHRVGMSQYGAEAMAAAGKTWEEILKHYYTGAEISRISDRLPADGDKS